jgi:hypothetical protein
MNLFATLNPDADPLTIIWKGIQGSPFIAGGVLLLIILNAWLNLGRQKRGSRRR